MIDRRVWQTQTEARLAVFTLIEDWYNPQAATLNTGLHVARQLSEETQRAEITNTVQP